MKKSIKTIQKILKPWLEANKNDALAKDLQKALDQNNLDWVENILNQIDQKTQRQANDLIENIKTKLNRIKTN